MQDQKRISVLLPTQLIQRLENYEFVSPQQRSQLIEALLEEYVADLDAMAAQKARQQERRDKVAGWAGKLRHSSKKAVEIMLP